MTLSVWNLYFRNCLGKSGRALQPAASNRNNDEPSRARTSDPLIRESPRLTPAGNGSHDLLTFVTGCSRRRVHLLLLIQFGLSAVSSQVCQSNATPVNDR